MRELATEAASGYEEYATYIDAFGLTSSELTTNKVQFCVTTLCPVLRKVDPE